MKIDRILKSVNFKKLPLDNQGKILNDLDALHKLDLEDEELNWLEKEKRYKFTITHYQGHWIPQLSMVLIFSVCTVRGVRLRLISTAGSEYRQAFEICRPHLEEIDQWKLSARFAAMRGRDDYRSIMEYLRGIADSNKVRLPLFTLS